MMEKKDIILAAQVMFDTVLEEVVGGGDYKEGTPESFKACMYKLEDDAYIAIYFKDNGLDDKTAAAITDCAYTLAHRQYTLTTRTRTRGCFHLEVCAELLSKKLC